MIRELGKVFVGKPLSIMGYLYIDHHRLMVSSIDTVSEGREVKNQTR